MAIGDVWGDPNDSETWWRESLTSLRSFCGPTLLIPDNVKDWAKKKGYVRIFAQKAAKKKARKA